MRTRYWQKALLNITIIALGTLLIYSGYILLTHKWSPVPSTLLFLGTACLLLFSWKEVNRRWIRKYHPRLLNTTLAVVAVALVCTFAGIEPLSSHKDNLIGKWTAFQTEQKEQVAKQAEVAQKQAKEEAKLATEKKAEEERQAAHNKKREELAAQIQADEEAGLRYQGVFLRNPSWSALKSFLASDDTDKMTYVYPTTVCFDFATKLQRQAKEAGWRCGLVRLDMTGYTDPYNYGISPDAGHACNVFETTDRGLVYIDCTRSQENLLHQDCIVDIQVGKQYNPKHIFPSGGWYIPEGQMGIVRSMSIQW